MQLAHQELFVSWINMARDRAKQQQQQQQQQQLESR